MKHLLLALALLCSPLAWADDYGQDPALDDQRMEKLLDMRMERMTEELNLSEEQQAKIRTLMEQHHEDVEKDRGRLKKDIDKVLSKEQQRRLEEWRQERRERFKGMIEKRRENRGQ